VTAIFAIASSVAFVAFLKEEVSVWWSLLLAAVTGVVVLALATATLYLGEVIERFWYKSKTRPKGPNPPDGLSAGEDANP
jgi:hypothetical protein